MEHNTSFERAIYWTRLSVRLVCTWPPPSGATKWQTTKENIAWSISFVSLLCLFVPLLHSIYEYRSNFIIVTHSTSLCFSCAMSLSKSLTLRLHRKKIQILIDEMEEFLKNAQPHEKQILRNNVNRFCMFHCAISFMNYLSSITISMSPFILPNQRMPTFATYPFSIDSGLPMYLIYVHQSIVGLQCSAGLTVDCQVALMMWFAGARLEILAEEIKKFKNIKNYSSIVKKHEKLLSYVVRVSGTMCYVAFTTSCVCGIALIMFCLQLVGNQPWSVKLQFGPGILVCFINLMVCTWPTENMMGMCDRIGTNVYSTPWVGMRPESSRDIIMILRRSQRPVQVSIGGFLPSLSFRFYASFLSAVFSYFTTIRLVVMTEADN
ncbi:uncharacterized protein [Venturia canescens]|uniref:uncharacterized protein n=1 Tax=Venturia canescens TaxID=32260 RepID=UPI001C9C43C5|nr:uncharacterized protein LOC122417880 [Venturia canescens]